MTRNEKIVAYIILFTSPIILYGLMLLLPVFDDWTYLTYPNTDPDFTKYFLPYGSYWRPFDALFGYAVALSPGLFPSLNHVFVFIGHITSTFLIWKLAKILHFSPTSRIITSLFYYISPAVLGAVTGIDTLNQVYVSVLVLAATCIYLKGGKKNTTIWLTLTTLSLFIKENGIMWFFIAPAIALAFKYKDKKQVLHDIIAALILCLIYGIVRLSLPNQYPLSVNIYTDNDILFKVRNFAKYIVLTYTCLDFVSLFYRPSFNIIIVVITTLLSLPFAICVLKKIYKDRKDIHIWLFIVLSIFAALPHILTLYSSLHAYAGLAPIALLLGYLYNKAGQKDRIYIITLAMLLLSSIIIDVRHGVKAWQSGIDGYELAKQTVKKTKKPTYKAFCYSIDNGEKKYSSFCEIPYNSFGWGNAVILYTHNEWPQYLKSDTINAIRAKKELPTLVQKKLRQGFDHIWIVNGKNVDVIEK